MYNSIKLIINFFLLVCVSVSLTLFAIKILAYKNAKPSEKVLNDYKSCYFVAYIPNYKPYGGIGRVLRLFSNQSFFVVYNKSGEELRSSAWYFWEYQFSDLVAPGWSGIDFLYPSDHGLSGWTFRECGASQQS